MHRQPRCIFRTTLEAYNSGVTAASQAIVAQTFLAPIGTTFGTGETRVIERPGWYQIITPGTAHPGRNEILYSVIDSDDDAEIERVIDETCAEYDALELPFKWCLGPLTRPVDMAERLARRGFATVNVRGMYCDPRRLKLRVPAGMDAHRIAPDRLDEFLAPFFEGWKVDEASQGPLRDDFAWAVARPEWYLFVATVGGEIAGSAFMFVKETSGYLMAGNVLPKYRGLGVYRALLEVRLQQLRRLGTSLATTQARETTSAPMLERLGFSTAYRGQVMRSPRATAHL